MNLLFGLHTFGDVTVDASGARSRRRRSSVTWWPRACWPTRSGSTSSAWASTTATTSPSRLPTSCWPRSRAGRAHPSRVGRHGAELRRPGARLPALLDPRRRLGRTRRGDPRPRLLHRVLPALRLRPRAVRAALRGEAAALRGAAQGGARDVGRSDPSRGWTSRRSTRRPPPGACRRGSRSAARRSRSCAPRNTASR